MPFLYKLSQKIEYEGLLPNLFYKVIILLPRHDRNEKLINNVPHEYRCKYSKQNFSKLSPTIYKKDKCIISKSHLC